MNNIIESSDREYKNLDINNFYAQGGTIEQLVDNFGDILIDSCKKEIDRQNFESVENVSKTYNLYVKSKDKTRIACAEECGVENISRDLYNCQMQVLLQSFCNEKELNLRRIGCYNIDFLDFSEIEIIEPQGKVLSNKQIVKEIRNGIAHKGYIILPEGIYIDNPQGPKHAMHFKAIIKTNFLLSFVVGLYPNIEKHYVNDVDYGDVDFEAGFDDNIDKIFIEELIPILDIPEGFENFDITQSIILDLYDSFKNDELDWLEKKRLFTEGEVRLFSKFFDNHDFGETELKICVLERNSWPITLFCLLGFFDFYNGTYEELINSEDVRNLPSFRHIANKKGMNRDLVIDLQNKYNDDTYVGLLPSYDELSDVLIHLIKNAFREDKTLLDRNVEERKDAVFQVVEAKFEHSIEEYISGEKYYRERKIELEMKNIEDELVNELSNQSEVSVKNEENINEDDTVIWVKQLKDGTMKCYCVQDEDGYYKTHKDWTWRDVREEAIKRVSLMDNDYKNEINLWKDSTPKEKESYLDMMKKDMMKNFDWLFFTINYGEVKLKMNIEGIPNYLKALNISSYYLNDPSPIFVGSGNIIPEWEHIRNAFAHINFSMLPGVDKILLRDPSRKKDIQDREKIYDLQSLYTRCAQKVCKRFK